MKHTIQKMIALLAIATMSIYAGDFTQEAEAPVEQVTQEGTMFIYGAGGISLWEIEATKADYANADALDGEGGLFEVGVGYRWDDNLFSTIAAQRNQLEIADIDTVFASINYQFDDATFKPYAGVLAGYSKMTWNEAPDTVKTDKDLESESVAYGIQFGVAKEVATNFSLFTKYQAIAYEHEMTIYKNGDTKEIDHKSSQNLMVGVQYGF